MEEGSLEFWWKGDKREGRQKVWCRELVEKEMQGRKSARLVASMISEKKSATRKEGGRHTYMIESIVFLIFQLTFGVVGSTCEYATSSPLLFLSLIRIVN